MEIDLSKLSTLLMAIVVGYVAYQKIFAAPPVVQLDVRNTPKTSVVADSPAAPKIVVPDSGSGSQRSGSQPQEQAPISAPSLQPPEPQPRSADVNDVYAVPLPNPTTQRRAYFDFLAKRHPRAFLICKDESVQVLTGGSEFIRKRLAEAKDQCAPYAIDDAVVWTPK